MLLSIAGYLLSTKYCFKHFILALFYFIATLMLWVKYNHHYYYSHFTDGVKVNSGLQRYQLASLTSETIFLMSCYCRCLLYILSLHFFSSNSHRNMEHYKILTRKCVWHTKANRVFFIYNLSSPCHTSKFRMRKYFNSYFSYTKEGNYELYDLPECSPN